VCARVCRRGGAVTAGAKHERAAAIRLARITRSRLNA
jgi:hypothetical protein